MPNPFTEPPPNFRDVGLSLNRIASREWLQREMLFRCGAIHAEYAAGHVGRAQTIVSLRGQQNTHLWATHIHPPKPDNGACYNTGDRTVRAWLRSIVIKLVRQPTATPSAIPKPG